MSALHSSREGDVSPVSSALERMRRFPTIYNGFFEHHVVPVLHIGTKRMSKLVGLEKTLNITHTNSNISYIIINRKKQTLIQNVKT